VIFYHYTCEDAATEIGVTGVLVPTPQPLFVNGVGQAMLVWLTDLPDPDVEGLGLTAHELNCDRSAVRYRARREEFTPWVGSRLHAAMPPSMQAEFHRGRTPAHWFVSMVPVAVIRDDPV